MLIPGLPEAYRWLPIVESQARAMMVANGDTPEEGAAAEEHGRYLVKLTAKRRVVSPAQFSTDVFWGEQVTPGGAAVAGREQEGEHVAGPRGVPEGLIIGEATDTRTEWSPGSQ